MALFKTGDVFATPAALSFLAENFRAPVDLVIKHVGGDWGDLEEDDIQSNKRALQYGGRIFSSYHIGDGKVWVITEADRSMTTLMLPEEY